MPSYSSCGVIHKQDVEAAMTSTSLFEKRSKTVLMILFIFNPDIYCFNVTPYTSLTPEGKFSDGIYLNAL